MKSIAAGNLSPLFCRVGEDDIKPALLREVLFIVDWGVAFVFCCLVNLGSASSSIDVSELTSRLLFVDLSFAGSATQPAGVPLGGSAV